MEDLDDSGVVDPVKTLEIDICAHCGQVMPLQSKPPPLPPEEAELIIEQPGESSNDSQQ